MNYHEQFMRIALDEAAASLKAGDFPVGCVLVANGQVLAQGRRINSGGPDANELDHAEVLTLRSFLQENPLYDLSGVTAYSTMEPCLMCYTTLLLSGIRRFVWAYEDTMGGGTSLPLLQLSPLYAEMQVENIPHVLRRESLMLFQDFFRRYSYWEESELARYTLAQDPES
jgi:tRNA(adenine34) deaminase